MKLLTAIFKNLVAKARSRFSHNLPLGADPRWDLESKLERMRQQHGKDDTTAEERLRTAGPPPLEVEIK